MKLFIIGNGFDLAHNLPTRYLDYKHFLYNQPNLSDFLREFEKAYGLSTTNDIWWKDFESNLGKGWYFEDEFENMAYSVIEDMVDEDGEPMPDVESALDIHFEPYYSFMKKLNETVLMWAQSIDLHKTKKITNKIANRDSLFFTFNYTLTLEERYKIDCKKVFHVHGSSSESFVVMGHGNADAINKLSRNAEKSEYKFEKNWAVVQFCLYKFYKSTYKDTKSIIKSNENIFNQYKDVKEVYVYGHSMGDVDKPYFMEIKRHISPDANWFIYILNSKDEKKSWIKKVDFLKIDNERLHFLESSTF